MPVEARFIEFGDHRLFVMHYRPAGDSARRRVVLLPPLTEELNKSRRLLAQIGRGLSHAGCEFVHLDLSGTGDSEGEFESARWHDWVDEIVTVASEKNANSLPLTLLGMRGGALLLDGVRQGLSVSVERVVAVQPVLDGRQYLQQLMRVRVIASKFAGRAESLNDLRASLERGEVLEIAGYGFTDAMVRSIEACGVAPQSFSGKRSARIVDVRDAEQAEPSALLGRLATNAGEAGVSMELRAVAGSQFWTSQEITAPESVIQATVKACVDD